MSKKLNFAATLATLAMASILALPAPAHAQAVPSNGGFKTRISEPQLPAALYARHTAHNLVAAQCNALANASPRHAELEGLRARGDTVLMMRGTIAAFEELIVIMRQCENSPEGNYAITGVLQDYARTRDATIATCTQVTGDRALCLNSPFRYDR